MLKKFNVSQECDTLVSLVWTGGCSGAYNLINIDWTFPLFKALCFFSSSHSSTVPPPTPTSIFETGNTFNKNLNLESQIKRMDGSSLGWNGRSLGPSPSPQPFCCEPVLCRLPWPRPPPWSLLCVGRRTDQKSPTQSPSGFFFFFPSGGFNEINPEASTPSPVVLGLLLFSALYLKIKNKQNLFSLLPLTPPNSSSY